MAAMVADDEDAYAITCDSIEEVIGKTFEASCLAALLYVRIHVSQAHRLGGIGVQLRVATQCLGHAFIIIESDRRQGPEQTRGKVSALRLWQEQCLSRDLLNAHTNPRLMPDLWPVNWPVCARETGNSADAAAVACV
jgi:hypothetical protein